MSMHYGSSGSKNTRLYTPSIGTRRLGEAVGTLPNLVWRTQGATGGAMGRARPTSGLKLTITHVDVPSAPSRQSHRSEATSWRPATQLRSRLNSRRGHDVRHTVPQKRQTSELLPSLPSTPGPSAPVTLPPIASKAEDEHPALDMDDGESSSPPPEENDNKSESESEIFSDEEEVQNLPSRSGLESEANSCVQISDLPFPAAADSGGMAPFPSTLLQDHQETDMQRQEAGLPPLGFSSQVNNIVRAFSIHGALDRSLLSQALTTVANMHPILLARFQRFKGTLYMQLPSSDSEKVAVNLECPVVSHEKPENLIAGARRKVFSLSKCKDLPLDCSSGEGWRQDSLLSLVNSEESLKKSARRVPSLSKIVSKKSVTFVDADPDVKEESADDCNSPHLPLVQSRLQLDEQPRLLMRARLVQQSAHDSILVLSFPRIVCDFWSSCLFVQQLTNTYARLEESSRHRPSLVGSRIRSFSRVETSFSRGPQPRVSVRGGRQHRRLSERVKTATGRWPKSMSFQQVALREAQLLKLVPKERLWTFWNSMITALIQRRHGATRVKVIPPIRLPSGLGEKTHTARPQTSRLRPLTARMRPQTARKTVGGMAAPRDTLAGPKSEFHFIKIEDVCSEFQEAFPKEQLALVGERELLCLFCLGAYVLLLARCCRGWGARDDRPGREKLSPVEDRASKRRTSYFREDPLKQYKSNPGLVLRCDPAVSESFPRRFKRTAAGGKLDLGSFLIGVEISLRHSHPLKTMGLFGPLTNDVGVRVNLSSCETFVDLVLALGRSLQLARNHYNFSFATATEELGIPAGLPVRFSYFYRSDVVQLTNPAHFYFPETAVGVEGHGLAKFGSSCYLSPLCTKMEDSRHLELCLWEGYDTNNVGGVFLFQPRLLHRGLVQGLEKELCQLMETIAADPLSPLSHLASQISPPFSSAMRTRTRRLY